MYEKAKSFRDNNTRDALNMEQFKNIEENKSGFVRAMWCGDAKCEEKIREVTGATSRCIPFDQEHISDTCVCCGKKADKLVYWGRAY